MFKNMSKTTLVTSIVSSVSALVILVTSIIRLFGSPVVIAGSIILIVAALLLIGSVVLNILISPKLSALASLSGSLIGLIGYRISVDVVEGIYQTPKAFLIIWLVCLIATFVVTIINYEKWQKIEEENIVKRLNIVSLIVSGITTIFLGYSLGVLFAGGGVISGIVCLLAILILIASKVLNIVFKFNFGKLIIILMPILLIMGTVPYEIGLVDNMGIIMVINYVLSFGLLISELATIKVNK